MTLDPRLSIAIPTYNRADDLRTLDFLPDSWKRRTRLVVRPSQEAAYAHHGVALQVLPGEWTLTRVRQWILGTWHTPWVLQLDDDLDFAWRPWQHGPNDEHPPHRLRAPAPPEEMERLWGIICQHLDDGFPHVGVSQREGNNRYPKPHHDTVRTVRAVAVDRAIALAAGASYERVPLMEDLDFTLQMLRAGHPNRCIFEFCQGQPGSATDGGWDWFRDGQRQKEAAEKLHALHPDFVRVRVKRSDNWGEDLKERHDVTVQWRRAYKSSDGPTDHLEWARE